MAFLSDYYSGQVGAGQLDWRDVKSMIGRGEALRYAPEDVGWLTDYQIRDMIDKQGAVLNLPQLNQRGQATGRYTTLDNPEVGPGGWRNISANEALIRGRNAAAGGRALADPAGLLPGLERQNYIAHQKNALATLDYLSQFLSPQQARDEVFKQTGIRLGEDTFSPNIDQRAEAKFKQAQEERRTRVAEENARAAREAAAHKPPTEFEAKAGLYFRSMNNASQVLNQIDDAGQSGVGLLEATTGPDALKNIVRGDIRQSYVQAQRQWIDSINRVRSGANLPEIEYNRAVKTFFPEFWDSPEVKRQKQAARAQEEQAMYIAAGRAGPRSGGAPAGGGTGAAPPVGAGAEQLLTPPAVRVPPPEYRQPGAVYETPQGPMRWTPRGWVNPDPFSQERQDALRPPPRESYGSLPPGA